MSTYSRTVARGLCAVSAGMMLAAAPVAAQTTTDDTISVTGVTGTDASAATITRVARVDKGDLDLRTLVGQRRLASRIGKAADSVCADVGLWTSRSTHDFYHCRNDAIETATAQVAGGFLVGAN